MGSNIKREELPVIQLPSGSEIIGIPSVHYAVEFASAVNSVCREKNLVPDAIAVEMNHSVVRETVAWLKYLGVSHDKKTSLPVGLAIGMKIQFLHPEKVHQVRALEKYFTKSLNNIPDQSLVMKVLQTNREHVFPLCNTDSIFEGIRSGLDLNVPVFGIDTLHCSGDYDNPVIFRNFDGSNLKTYINENALAASNITNKYDQYICRRREMAMAARLKALGLHFKRILFICGLSHWDNIAELLANADLKPANIITDKTVAEPERVILHPSLCAAFISKYPIVSSFYEERRLHCQLNGPGKINPVPYADLLNDIYRNAKNIYSKKSAENRYDPLSFRSLLSFDTLCQKTKLLNLNTILSMDDFLANARGIFPDEFYDALVERFFKGVNFANPLNFPGIPVLAPEIALDGLSERQIVKYFQRDDGTREIIDRQPAWNNGFWRQHTLIHEYRTEQDNEYLNREIKKKGWSIFVWPPKEVELFLLSLRTIQLAENMKYQPIAKKYNGSIEAGINIKESIRQSVSGNKLQIIVNSRRKSIKSDELPDAQPVVFIFENNPVKEPFIRIYDAGIFCSDFIAPEIYKKYSREGTNTIAHISYFGDRKPGSRFDNIVGDLGFGSMCVNTPQSAYWLVRTQFKACPVLKEFSVSCLNNFYKSRYNLKTSTDFKEQLLIYALPYCHSGKLFVLAPSDFKPTDYINKQAVRLGVEIKIVPLTKFPDSTIQSVRERICCYSTDDHGVFYSTETEKIMGQRFNAGFDLLPERLRKELAQIYRDFAFLKPPKNNRIEDEEFPF